MVAFLVLTTFVVEPAVYNFMQTQKERQPCKIKASAINKKSARRRTRSGGPRTARTGAERRHRTFEPWQGSKKRTIPIWYRSFFKRETGIEPATPPWQGGAPPLSHSRIFHCCDLFASQQWICYHKTLYLSTTFFNFFKYFFHAMNYRIEPSCFHPLKALEQTHFQWSATALLLCEHSQR